MAGRQEIVYPEYTPFDPNSLWYKTLSIARRHAVVNIESLTEIVYQEANENDLRDVAESADTAFRVSSLIEEELAHGNLVVVDDNTNARVVGINPFGKNRIQMIIINRFGKEDETLTTIINPHIEAGFTDGMFELEIHGVVKNGNGFDNVVRKVATFSPDGNNNPPSFFIATKEEVLFGRIDARQSFSCSQAYRGGLQWASLVRERAIVFFLPRRSK